MAPHDDSPLGSILAASADLSGTVSLNGAESLVFDAISNAIVDVGAGSSGKLSLVAGAVSNTQLTSAVPITVLRADSWISDLSDSTPIINPTITAPSIGTLSISGLIESNLSLTATGRTASLGSVRVGQVENGTWEIAGRVGSVTANSIGTGWAGLFTARSAHLR